MTYLYKVTVLYFSFKRYIIQFWVNITRGKKWEWHRPTFSTVRHWCTPSRGSEDDEGIISVQRVKMVGFFPVSSFTDHWNVGFSYIAVKSKNDVVDAVLFWDALPFLFRSLRSVYTTCQHKTCFKNVLTRGLFLFHVISEDTSHKVVTVIVQHTHFFRLFDNKCPPLLVSAQQLTKTEKFIIKTSAKWAQLRRIRIHIWSSSIKY